MSQRPFLRLHIDILRAPTLIIVAEERVSSKLWHGRKDDEYLGFWDTFVPTGLGSALCGEQDIIRVADKQIVSDRCDREGV